MSNIYTIDFIKKRISELSYNKYKCLSNNYIEAHSKLIIECDKGHIFNMSWASFSQGHRCPKCKFINKTLPEKYIRNFVEKNGFKSRYGFSPPKGLPKELRKGRYKVYFSENPSIDIRHSKSLTRTRMDKSQFRSERSCRGWTEADEVPGWGKTKGCFNEFLCEVVN